MPIRQCRIDNKPGYKWGQEGKCYDYNPGDEQSKYDAKRSAISQGIAIGDFEAIAIQVALFKGTYKFSETDIELESYTDYPESVKNNAKRALAWVEKNGWGPCGEATGKARANQLANGEPISRDTIARMASFKRHQQNKDVPYSEGCGGLMWDAWGGTSGVEWASSKLKEIDSSTLETIKKLATIGPRGGVNPSDKAPASSTKSKSLSVELAGGVGFDFDGVLSTLRGQTLARQTSAEVYIITARSGTGSSGYYGTAEVYKIADKLNIPRSNVFFEGSNQNKIARVKQLGLSTFYDNNPDVINGLPSIGKIF